MSSGHLLLGRPLDLFPLLCCHSVHRLVQPPSFILAVCPTHFHFCFSVCSIMSIIFVLFLTSDHGISSCSLKFNIGCSTWMDNSQSKDKPNPQSTDGSKERVMEAGKDVDDVQPLEGRVCLLVGCLTSQQHASVSQGRICTDNFTCCHSEIAVVDQIFYLTQSQYIDTGLTSPSADL